MKKGVITAILTISCGLLLVGCGKTSTASTGNTSAKNQPDKLRLYSDGKTAKRIWYRVDGDELSHTITKDTLVSDVYAINTGKMTHYTVGYKNDDGNFAIPLKDFKGLTYNGVIKKAKKLVNDQKEASIEPTKTYKTVALKAQVTADDSGNAASSEGMMDGSHFYWMYGQTLGVFPVYKQYYSGYFRNTYDYGLHGNRMHALITAVGENTNIEFDSLKTKGLRVLDE